jgi:hypothetical protein
MNNTADERFASDADQLAHEIACFLFETVESKTVTYDKVKVVRTPGDYHDSV